MTVNELIDKIKSLSCCITFDYKGNNCGVDPISHSHFDMWCGDKEYTASSIDEVIAAKIFNDNTITDIWGEVTDIDY